MNVAQTWIVVGIPALVIAAALFVGQSRRRAVVGYGCLAATVAVFAFTPGGGASAAAIGLVTAVLVATGRGTSAQPVSDEHHVTRGQFTTAAR